MCRMHIGQRFGTDDPVGAGLVVDQHLWPNRSCSFCVTRRAVTSVNPPGGYGTITRIGLAPDSARCVALLWV